VSKPAHRPPDDSTKLELVMAALSEVLALALASLAGFAVALALVWVGILPAEATWSGLLLGSVSIGSSAVVYMIIEHYARDSVPARPLVWKRDRKSIGTCLLIVLGGFVVALLGTGVLGAIQEQLFSIEVTEQEAITKLVEKRDTFELVLLTISAVVLAPVSEELFFRHMFFRRLLHGAGPTLAWILPALAFSLFHFNLPGLVIYVWLGLVFAAAYLFSGRLWVAMAVHASYNAAGVALLLWMPELS
jgi:membrane protease YdiL (CAAX protease family)